MAVEQGVTRKTAGGIEVLSEREGRQENHTALSFRGIGRRSLPAVPDLGNRARQLSALEPKLGVVSATLNGAREASEQDFPLIEAIPRASQRSN